MIFVVCRFFSKSSFSENSFRNTCTIRVSNSLDPDQARHFVGPDLDPNCLQMLSADDTSRQRVKPGTNREVIPVKKSFLYFIQIPIPWPARIRIHRFRVQEPFYAYRSTELAYIILTDAQAFPKPGCHKIIMWLIRLFSTGLSHCELENEPQAFEPFHEQATR